MRSTIALAMIVAAASALAASPFETSRTPRMELSLSKDATPGTASSPSSAQPADKAPVRTRSIAEQVNQSQTGLLNAQATDAGSARISGKAVQTQSGTLNKQERKLGIATDGAKADVAVRDVTQAQRGVLNDQKVQVGTAGQ
jgi:hypothetical protein